MKVEIETYRGWEIYFDTDKEEFYTVSNEYDKQETKKSFASTKKFIDDYIKDFKPFYIQNMGWSRDFKTIKVIGIRKDKRFIVEDEKGEKKQLSEYSEKDYIIKLDDNQGIINDIITLRKEKADFCDKIEKQEKELIRKLNIKSLVDYKNQTL